MYRGSQCVTCHHAATGRGVRDKRLPRPACVRTATGDMAVHGPRTPRILKPRCAHVQGHTADKMCGYVLVGHVHMLIIVMKRIGGLTGLCKNTGLYVCKYTGLYLCASIQESMCVQVCRTVWGPSNTSDSSNRKRRKRREVSGMRVEAVACFEWDVSRRVFECGGSLWQ